MGARGRRSPCVKPWLTARYRTYSASSNLGNCLPTQIFVVADFPRIVQQFLLECPGIKVVAYSTENLQIGLL